MRKSGVLFRVHLAILVAIIALSSCADSDGALPPVARGCAARPGQRLKLVEVGRDFTQPIAVQAPLKDPRIFVVEQIGRIWQIRDGVRHGAPFLDISKQVSTGNERGLFGVAFHPDFAENGRFFVSYTDVRGDSVIAEYQAAPTAYVANPIGATILTVRQPAANNICPCKLLTGVFRPKYSDLGLRCRSIRGGFASVIPSQVVVPAPRFAA